METKNCSKCKENLPLDEFPKRARSKDGLGAWCKPCQKEYREANKHRLAEQNKAWRLANKEKVAADKKDWREKNREAYNAQMARARAKPSNQAAKLSLVRKRQAAKLQRTPPWADMSAITEFYVEAKRLEELTGIQFHVDHIVPLQGELVSGLHVAANLQLLPAHENLCKSNRFEVAA